MENSQKDTRTKIKEYDAASANAIIAQVALWFGFFFFND